MRGSGSPTSISTTRLPAKAVVTSTVADGSGRTSPENSRILSPGVCVSAKSPASAHSAATTARNCPSLAMWRGSSPSNSHAPRTVSRTGIFADLAEGETHVNQHPIPRDWFFVLDQPKVYAPAPPATSTSPVRGAGGSLPGFPCAATPTKSLPGPAEPPPRAREWQTSGCAREQQGIRRRKPAR